MDNYKFNHKFNHKFNLPWSHGYALLSVYEARDSDGPHLMRILDIPITAKHMDLTESYPSTFDAVHGNYQ